MRGCRRNFISALAAVVLASGCAEPRDVARALRSPPALPAPKNPDLGTVMERFYQQLEGGHWGFAYAMLAPAYRARLSESQLTQRYSIYASFDVTLRQRSDTLVTARIEAVDRDARPQHAEETVRLNWDGADWKIAGIRRRALSPADTP